MKKFLCCLLLSACVTGSPTSKPPKLDGLPKCEAGANVGALTLKPNICTKKHCEQACCNQCSWMATFEGKNGQPVPAEPAQVQALLGLGESALDCELAEWSTALSGQSVSIDPPACAVR